METLPEFIEAEAVLDDMTDHLLVLHAEFEQTVYDMEQQNATTAAAAYYHVQLTCERFLATPDCFG